MKHKLGICIPYRNRFEHLKELVETLSPYLNKRGIEHKFYVAHQIDEKLFNRGLMKNIAAKFAFDDGCDYIAWHDVDMVPASEDCDYSYPENHPVHIATMLSKYDYKLNYEQYFGGVILFSKEQVMKTNGYSNDYWDWGMEDDDLFYRCHFEGYSNCRRYEHYENKSVAKFNGNDSYVEIPWSPDLKNILTDDHTISVLFKPVQQPEKYNEWLIGEENKEFIEFPIFRKKSWCPYSINFNNSRAVTNMFYNKEKSMFYTWLKREDNVWSWVTTSYNSDSRKLSFYLNDEFGRSNEKGLKEKESTIIPHGSFKYEDKNPIYLGTNGDEKNPIFFRGEIAEVLIFDKCIKNHKKIKDFQGSERVEPIFHLKFEDAGNNKIIESISGREIECKNLEFSFENFDVSDMPIPHRREGMFMCLPHVDEGLVNNKWAKGETTARNERRFVTQMQKKLIDYKNDGMNSMSYEIVTTKEIWENTLLINCKCK